MTFTLRRTIWADWRPSTDPEDYQVFKDGEALGRISRSRSSGPGPYCRWLVYGARRGGRPHAGIVDSLDEAKVAWLYAFQGSTPKPESHL
jgi:hypothetical protein